MILALILVNTPFLIALYLTLDLSDEPALEKELDNA